MRAAGVWLTLSALHYALLYNPIAGRGRATAVADAVARRLVALGHRAREGQSERAGHIREMARDVAGDVERVLVLGGDGSLREAAMGLLERDPAARPELGVLPFGSGNVVARELGLPLDPLRAVDSIASSSSLAWDVGWARADGGEREPFLAMAGIGYDAAIAERIAASRASRMGARWYRLSADSLYAWIGLSQLFAWPQPRFGVEVDGEPLAPRAVAAVLSNTRTYAKGMRLSPGARPDDGRLDLHVRRSASFVHGGLALVLAQLCLRSPRWVAREFGGATVRITAASMDAPAPWQVDGDAMGRVRKLEIEIERGPLRLVGPLAARVRDGGRSV